MLIEIIISLLFGILAGTFTGLIPGIHINLVGTFLIFLYPVISIAPIYLVVFIVALSITHTFIDFIPSVFLGCSNTTTELSVLPGHELLKQGNGYEAVILTAYGGITAIVAILLLAFPFVFLVSPVYDILKSPYIIIIALTISSLFLIFSEKKKFSALLVFFLAGILGLCILNLGSLNQPLLPLLTGLFGGSTIIMSIKDRIKIPEQKLNDSLSIDKKKIIWAFLGSLIAIPLSSLFPALGSGQTAVIGSQISGIKNDRKAFLFLNGAINLLIMGFSFISFYAISKTRTGSAVVVKELLGNFSAEILIVILGVIFISGISAFFLTKFLAGFFSRKIGKINYTALSYITIAVLVIIVAFVSGFLGLLVLSVSALTGIYCISLNVKRTQMMGCLILPTIWIYLGVIFS